MIKKKWLYVTSIMFFALITGLYFSGYLTLTFLRLGTGLLKWNTYLVYFRARGRSAHRCLQHAYRPCHLA